MLESSSAVSIVLMDIMMPGMDGYETMQVIRRNSKYRRLPIIALTAKADERRPRKVPGSRRLGLPGQAR